MLRVEIAGNWAASEFAEFYGAADEIYTLFALIDIERREQYEMEELYHEWLMRGPGMMKGSFRRWRRFRGMQMPIEDGPLITPSNTQERLMLLADDGERLLVRRCQFASPGSIDFTGIGAALGHLKDLVLGLSKLGPERREIEARADILEHDLLKQQISTLLDLGYTKKQVRKIVATTNPTVSRLEKLVQHGKVIDARVIDGDQ